MHRSRRTGLNSMFFAGVVAAAMLCAASAAFAGTSQVLVPRGKPVQIAVVLDNSSIGMPYYAGARNAIQMAVQLHAAIDGYRIQLNDGFDAPCAGANALAQGLADATAVVSNTQNVAVLGPFCSFGLIDATYPGPCLSQPPATALSTYENAGVVMISGTTTNPCLPAVGPTVFDSTTVPDPGSDVWYRQVTALPRDRLWQFGYRLEFGVAPTPYADLYFDATRLLLTRIQQTARVVSGNLVIDRAALARAVRQTSHFAGVTCSISLDPATGYRIDDPIALARCGTPRFGQELLEQPVSG